MTLHIIQSLVQCAVTADYDSLCYLVLSYNTMSEGIMWKNKYIKITKVVCRVIQNEDLNNIIIIVVD